MAKERGPTKCRGRFGQLRDQTDVAANLLDSEGLLTPGIQTQGDLSDIVDFSGTDWYAYDPNDSFYVNSADGNRTLVLPAGVSEDELCVWKQIASVPERHPTGLVEESVRGIGLVPMLIGDYSINGTLVEEFARQYQPSNEVMEALQLFTPLAEKSTSGTHRLGMKLGIDPKHIVVPRRGKAAGVEHLAGYHLMGGFGFGMNDEQTLVYDAPWHVEVHSHKEKGADTGVLGVGFWVNEGNQMLLGQIQSMHGANEQLGGLDIGTVGLAVAEKVATAMGFSSLRMYSARSHPQFLMHPEDRGKHYNHFQEIFNRSARALDYTPVAEGSKAARGGHYIGFVKHLR
ncbi:MAG: hypothetical protein ACOCWQ_05005 [Nanoarchaeota archaeon]